MVDSANGLDTKSALALASSGGLGMIAGAGGSHLAAAAAANHGMKLEAVMENLQRQQQARLEMEERERERLRDRDIREAQQQQHQQHQHLYQQQQQQYAALRAAALSAAAAAVASGGAGGSRSGSAVARHRPRGDGGGDDGGGDSDADSVPGAPSEFSGYERYHPLRHGHPGRRGASDYDEEDEEEDPGEDAEEEDEEEDPGDDEGEDDGDDAMEEGDYERRSPGGPASKPPPAGLALHLAGGGLGGSVAAAGGSVARHLAFEAGGGGGQPLSPGAEGPQPSQAQDWTYEEQFKQLYELDDDPKRKEFLDDLFSFMQKRGTPVNRIPIMAKQVLDLHTLYKLVTEKGGLVEVINKKIWREITKGLNLPTSITSAAFTLRTQYMKYLYPYECEKKGLSSPAELQAAIDSNRREGRRPSFGSPLYSYTPPGPSNLLPSPKMHLSSLGIPGLTNGTHMSSGQSIKKEDDMGMSGHRLSLPVPLAAAAAAAAAANQHAAAAAAAQVQAQVQAQAQALEQLREKLESGEPPEKKMAAHVAMAMAAEEQQRIMQQVLQQNLIAMAAQIPMSIKINSREERQEMALNLSTNGTSSINMSIEINGILYTGVLFARRPQMPVVPPSVVPSTSSGAGGGGGGSASSSSSSHSGTVSSFKPSSSWET
ncbi:unnamed protein product [Lampetra fluviatilis]